MVSMSWFFLFVAGLLEIVWAVGLKFHEGRPLWITGVALAAMASVALLNVAVDRLPLGTAYAVWTGIGVVGTFAAGCALFGETFSLAKCMWTVLILIGIAGLKFTP